jgi:hypothetical protein
LDEEYDYLVGKYKGYKLVVEEFINEINNRYDQIRIQLPTGTNKEVRFEINNFYIK